MSSADIVIAGAGRTAVGAFNGAFTTTPAHQLGAAVIADVLGRAKVAPEEVDEVILGQILTAGQGQNPARQASIGAGLPQETTAWGVNQLCGSGLRSVALGMQQIATGDAEIIVAGGQEFDVDGAPLRLSPRRREDGRFLDDRHHDQGRPVGRLQRLSHGKHRRERRPRVSDHPRPAGRVRGEVAEQGRGGAEGGQVQGRDRARDNQDEEGRYRRRSGRVHSCRRHARRGRQAQARFCQGRHGHCRQCLGYQ